MVVVVVVVVDVVVTGGSEVTAADVVVVVAADSVSQPAMSRTTSTASDAVSLVMRRKATGCRSLRD